MGFYAAVFPGQQRRSQAARPSSIQRLNSATLSFGQGSSQGSLLVGRKIEPVALHCLDVGSVTGNDDLGAGGWWTNPKGVGLNVSYLAKNSTAA